jgi:hypothetical protein
MPKGETSRPYNRKEKQAAAREKQREELLEKTLKRGSSSPKSAIDAVRNTKSAKEDSRTLAKNRVKETTRQLANKSQKDFLSGMPADEYRERTMSSRAKRFAEGGPVKAQLSGKGFKGTF